MYKTSMNNSFQHTINKITIFDGIGLHTGKNTKIKLIPSDSDSGITFVRTDLH